MKIKWRKGTQYGARRVYASKCGRFTIERREYDLPRRSTAYVLLDSTKAGKVSRTDHDTLTDAKEWAQDIADGNA